MGEMGIIEWKEGAGKESYPLFTDSHFWAHSLAFGLGITG